MFCLFVPEVLLLCLETTSVVKCGRQLYSQIRVDHKSISVPNDTIYTHVKYWQTHVEHFDGRKKIAVGHEQSPLREWNILVVVFSGIKGATNRNKQTHAHKNLIHEKSKAK